MSITTNPQDPALREIEQSGMQKSYLVLSDRCERPTDTSAFGRSIRCAT
jgi:hypothetical protein